jgi:benzoyl-CoA reductase/2-hydroxyglutaryl-CoA dehydratase subunit BcrC/BadD/HgdB
MQDMLSHYQVDGVIELVLHGCHTFAVEAYYTKKFVTETIDLPYVCIDADFSSSDAGQIRTRLAAFLEIVESRG